tara:strand:+ start:629 stop:862 length:234 start_codon:yes stop_codon:yes gene_type:complete
MKITKTRLKEIIKEELESVSEAGMPMGPGPGGDPGQADKLLRDLKGIVQALGGQNLNAHNLETVQGILDGLKASVME